MRLAASRMQLAASCMQNRKFFSSTLHEQLFELKNEDAIKKSENLRDTCACQGLSINTMHGPIQSRETVPLKLFSALVLTVRSKRMRLDLSASKKAIRENFYPGQPC